MIIRPLSRDDFPLLQRWLAMPHVQAWWGSEPVAPADVERKYGPQRTAPTRPGSALEKAGFSLVGQRKLDSDDPSDVGPSAVYALTRPGEAVSD